MNIKHEMSGGAFADVEITILLKESDSIKIDGTVGAVKIVLKGGYAFQALKKALAEIPLPGSQRKNDVPESYERPDDTEALCKALVQLEKPGSTAIGFLQEAAKKEERWGLSEKQEAWLRSLAHKAFPDGKLPVAQNFGGPAKPVDMERTPF